MINIKKRIMAAVMLTVITAAALTACSSGSSKNALKGPSGNYKIGIGQFAQHPSLDNCREGFMAGLKDEGYQEGVNVTYFYDNAETNGGFANQIYTNYINNNMDMMVAIATPMAQSAYSLGRDKNIPIIYTAITDPIAAELADTSGKPVGNITGTSDKLPVKEQLELIHSMYPNATKVGILYTTSEVNSLSSIEEYKNFAKDYGIEIISKGINDTSDMPLACDSLLGQVDVVTNVTDNTVVASLPVLLEKANAKNIPVFGSEIEQVKMGCIACMGLDYFELGKQTGRMAAKILSGQTKASDMPYEIIENASLYFNKAAAEKIGYTKTEGFDVESKATEVFDKIS